MQTAIIKVNALSFLQIIPPFSPPQTTTLPAQTLQTDSAAVTEFGGTNSAAIGTESTSTTSGGTAAFNSDTDYIQSGFTQRSETTSTPITNTNILWGAAATAMLGATLADWQRKREEEEARKRAEAAAQEQGGGGSGKKTPGQRAYEAMMKQKHIVGASQALLDERANEKAEQSEQARQSLIAKNEDKAPVDMAKVQQLVEAQKKAELQAGLSAYYESRKAGEENKPKEKTWWEQRVDWADQHQVEISVAVGVAVGVAAIILSGGVATPWVAAAWIAGVATVAGGAVAIGTVGLNAYYDRSLGTNVVRNLFIAGGTAAVLTGTALLLAPWVSTTVASICTNYATACSQVGTIIDKGEEALLAGQITYYNWIGDQDNAAQAAIQLQLEQMDGDAPGNTVATELGEQLAKLGDDVPELIATYGDDIIPLLLKYQDDAVDIIGAYGDEGIALLVLYGDDAISLITTHGTPAVDLMLEHGDTAIDALQGKIVEVDNIEEFVTDIKNVFPDARVWFSTNSGQVYFSNSSEQALNASQKLAEANAKGEDITGVISEIAAGPTHGSGNRVVLGAYDLNGGYIGEAIENGGIFFNTGDQVWDQLTASNTNPWRVNEQFMVNQLNSPNIDRIDFVGEDVQRVIDLYADVPFDDIPKFGYKEIIWMYENAQNSFELVGNSWVRKIP